MKLSAIFDLIPRYFRISALTSADFNSDLHALIKTNPGITAGWLMQRLGEKYKINPDQLRSAMISAVKQLKSEGQIEVRPGPRHNTFVYFPIEKRSAGARKSSTVQQMISDPAVQKAINNWLDNWDTVDAMGTLNLVGEAEQALKRYSQVPEVKKLLDWLRFNSYWDTELAEDLMNQIARLVFPNAPPGEFKQLKQQIPNVPGLPSSIDESGKSWRDRPSLASTRNSIMGGKTLTQDEVFEAMDEGDVEILIKMEAHNPQNLKMIRQCLETSPDFSEGIALIDSYLQPHQQVPHVPNLPSSLDESGKSWRDRPPLANRRSGTSGGVNIFYRNAGLDS